MNRSKIQAAVNRCMRDFNVDPYHVEVVKIAQAEKIKVIKNSEILKVAPSFALTGSEKGKLYSDGELWVIVYDDTQATADARFTVAHELGHYFLRHRERCYKLIALHNAYNNAFTAHLRRHFGELGEQEASYFAECLLRRHGAARLKIADV